MLADDIDKMTESDDLGVESLSPFGSSYFLGETTFSKAEMRFSLWQEVRLLPELDLIELSLWIEMLLRRTLCSLEDDDLLRSWISGNFEDHSSEGGKMALASC